MVATNLDGLEKFTRDLTRRRIPDGTHWVVHEKPELVTNIYENSSRLRDRKK